LDISHNEKQAQNVFEVGPWCSKVQGIFMAIYIPVFLSVLGLAIAFGYYDSNRQEYDSSDWQYCYIEGDLVGHFLKAISYQCLQNMLFSVLPAIVMFRAYNHPEWLPSSIAFCLFSLVSLLTFYTSTPILPIALSMNPSTIIFTKYVNPELYDDLTVEDCGTALDLIYFALTVWYLLAAFIVVVILLGARAEYARQKTAHRRWFDPLSGTAAPSILTGTVFVGYITTLMAKMSSSMTAIDVFRNDYAKLFAKESFFLFEEGSLDITTVLLVVSMMAVIRGYTKQSISAFRLAAITTLVQVLTAYPGIIGNLRYYEINDLWDMDSCKDFVANGPPGYSTNPYGAPDDDQMTAYCRDAQASMAGSLIIFITMHILSFACGYTFYVNKGRKSEVHDPMRNSDVDDIMDVSYNNRTLYKTPLIDG
jgi:hypothetical protein